MTRLQIQKKLFFSGTAKFTPQNINPYLCTHLIYAFGGLTKDDTIQPFDKYQDIEKGKDLKELYCLADLSNKTPSYL